MLSGHRPARRRPRDRRAARIAAPLGVPMALGLTLGIVLALSGGNGTKIDQSSLGASPKPTQAPAVAAQPQASAGAVSSASASCGIIVPASPLSARGLATPYQLTGPSGTSAAASGCTPSALAARAGLVRATILDPATGALAVYTPVVVAKGARPAIRAARAPAAAGRHRHHRLRLRRHGPGPGGRDRGRAGPGALRQRPRPGVERGLVLQRRRVLHGGAAPAARGPATGAGRGHLGQHGGHRGPDRDRPGLPGRAQLRGGRPGPGRSAPWSTASWTRPSAASRSPRPTWRTATRPRPRWRSTNCWRPGTSRRPPPWSRRTRWRGTPAAGSTRPGPTRTGPSSASRPSARRPTSTTAPRPTARTWSTSRPRSWPPTPTCSPPRPRPCPAAGSNLLTYLASRLSTAFGRLGCRQFGLADPVTLVRDAAGTARSATFDTTPQRATARGGG